MGSVRRGSDFQVAVRTDSLPEVEVLYRTLSFNNAATINGTHREPKPLPIKAHLLRPDDLFVGYSTDPKNGLTSAAATEKSLKGVNVLSPPKTNYVKKFLGYLFGGFNALMWIACILTLISWKPLGGPDAPPFGLGVGILMALVICASTFFYAYVDWNASRIMKSIQNLVAHQAVVIRDGKEQRIDASTLVVGDVVLLSMGQRIPADVRLIEVSSDLKFDRSLLTGESVAVAGTVEPTSENPLETKNVALSSTFVLRGRGRGVVIQIGDNTVIGQILKMSSKQKTVKTPIQAELDFFTVIISAVAVTLFGISMLVWVFWIRKSYPNYATASTAIINAIGCLTAFVPQGLPVCFALALTIIARRMAARQVLVKNLSTVETLGCMSVLCSDKTGTLTVGRMAVHSSLFLDKSLKTPEIGSDQQVKESEENPALQALHIIASICNDAKFLPGNENLPISDRPINGDATDAAILKYSEQFRSLFPSLHDYTTIFTMAFNSKNKFMAKIVRKGAEPALLLVKGAPDILLQGCNKVMNSKGGVVDLGKSELQEIGRVQDEASSEGLRVLALCQRSLKDVQLPLGNQDALEKFVLASMQSMTVIGMLALRDPPRADVLEAVKAIRRAGVRVFMVTGDFELTACSIARQVGIITSEKVHRLGDLDDLKKSMPLKTDLLLHDMRPSAEDTVRTIVVNGAQLDALKDNDWDYIATMFSEMVFARTTPEQKLLIVENLKKRGDNVVAVTGDGTNDAPALKAADIGVAMGSGTDVAKEAAAMILLNNDFSSLLVGIENGRLVFENLKKVVLYVMPAGTYTEFIAVIANVIFGMQIPLSSFQQVLFCVTNDIIMSISLMFENAESNLMERPPRNARTGRLTDWRFFIQIYLIIGPCIWLSAMGMWFMYMSEQGIRFYDLVLAYDKWGDGWAGKSLDQLNSYVSVGQCIYYVTMAICQFGTLFSIRNRSVSLLESNPFSGPRKNLVVFLAMIGSILVCIISLYGPGIQTVFGTAPIPVKYWFIPFGFAVGIVCVDETRKALVRAYPKSFLAKIAW